MRGGREKSLFFEVTLAILLVVTSAVLVNAGVAAVVGRTHLDRLVRETLSLQTSAVMGAVERHLEHCTQELALWSRLDILDDVLIHDRLLHIENLLLTLQRDHPGQYEYLAVLDRDEMVVASTDVASIGSRIALGELNLESRGPLRVGVLHEKDGTPRESLLLVAPVVSRLHVDPIGWFVARPSWPRIRDAVTRVSIGGRRQSKDRFFVLADPELGAVAGDPEVLGSFGSRLATLRLEPDGQVTAEDWDGVTYLVARQHMRWEYGVPLRDYVLVGAWRAREARGAVSLFLLSILVSAVIGAALTSAASFVFTRRITRRIRSLTQATARLAGGELAHRVAEGRNDEIGQLARSFNAMAERLAEARDTLAATIARWRSLVENAPDFIVTIDPEGTIRFTNRAVPGVARNEVLGTSLYSWIDEKYHEELRRVVVQVIATGEPASLELEGTGPHRGTAWYAVRVGPIKQDQQVAALTVISTDITERKRMEADILDVSEAERQRIGRDLHDDLGQVLTGVSLLTKGLHQRLVGRAPTDAAQVQQIGELIGQAIEHARAMARGLFPLGLERNGLAAALEELASTVDGMSGASCSFRSEAGPAAVERTAATHLFRIAQEAVSNALRHAEARTIRITLGRDGKKNQLVVEDDGKGMPPDDKSENGLGLRLMKYRASVIGASVEVCERFGGGTVVRCRF